MIVKVQYRYPEDVEADPQAKYDTDYFDVPPEVFERIMGELGEFATVSSKENR